MGQKGVWSEPVSARILDRIARVTSTPEEVVLRAGEGSGASAHVVRIQDDAIRNGVESPRPTVLIAVTGADSVAEAIDVAIKADTFTDQNPQVKEFLDDRVSARVFKSQRQGRQHLEVDRAIASAAFACYQFVRLERSASAAS